MAHSNSSLNTFTNCMSKYELQYIQHKTPSAPPSPHLVFGAMAHEVLYKAGKIREDTELGIDYDVASCIPSEVVGMDLKEYFKINNWYNYFMPIIKQCYQYEKDIIRDLQSKYSGNITIERELKLQATPDELAKAGYTGITNPLVGVIDLLIMCGDHAVILDYKFSNNRKTQDDFDINSQLPIYAFLVNLNYKIPVRNIEIGYIDIPKQAFDEPVILKNGTVSRSKSQNVLAEEYRNKVIEVHGFDDPYYNCDEGGYYEEIYNNLKLIKVAYLSKSWLDIDVYEHVLKDVLNTARMIEHMQKSEWPFLAKYDSYSCKNCDYIEFCKPWLYGNDHE